MNFAHFCLGAVARARYVGMRRTLFTIRRSRMTNVAWPDTQSLRIAFDDEVRTAGGHICDAYHDVDASRLFVRAVLPLDLDVRTRDRVQGGVAMRATDQDVSVHPYIFRIVCRNGAI